MTDKTDEIKYIHVRTYSIEQHGGVTGPDPKGGMTIAYYHDAHPDYNEQVIHFAVALCADKDNYVRKYGRAKASGRLHSPHHHHSFTCTGGIGYRELDDMIVEQANALVESRHAL
jgi:hypothetical protein